MLNIGIVAHVDAGKTSLTERILFHSGVIGRVGSVDDGDTQTDSMDLERRRGITIRSAVVAFTVGDLRVNLIDTPGHPDFIAEVERVLRVLDGAVLVLSAVEGVQAQTRVLMRALTRLGIPVLLFVNKIDRRGARHDELLHDIRRLLTPAAVPVATVEDLGTPHARAVPAALRGTAVAELLAEHSDAFLRAYLDDDAALTEDAYRAEVARQSRRGQVHPVFFGSAVTGEGVAGLVGDLGRLLPVAAQDGPLRATVFKIEHGRARERIAYVRVHAGTLAARERVAYHRREPHGAVVERAAKLTAVRTFERGTDTTDTPATAGAIAKVWGLTDVRIGDQLGTADGLAETGIFLPPSLETIVRPGRPGGGPALHAALQRLAEQDPLISLRRDELGGELSVRLYGEVQKEILASTLAETYGVQVEFTETRPVCVETVVGHGEAVEEIGAGGSPFWATVGLRVGPATPGTGIRFDLAVELGALPAAYHKAIEETVRGTLTQGLYGWEVPDCVVTLTRTGYFSPISAAGDFRKLTPLVLMEALRQAGTRVHEPVNRFELEIPPDCLSAVLARLARARAVTTVDSGADGADGTAGGAGGACHLRGTLPASAVHDVEQDLPGLSHGAAVFSSELSGYQPVTGEVPTRARTDNNPVHREEYLLRTMHRA
ncbi:TetM/TetW/TetO/TetS family tetracycline resistance ribosomal protection protein [Dactylosporangium aurantiacum]|uniref:TetM/TetW/TetO/TetS family tetracycline resistance ribosomal protection protein n=1 Tax=Dactylosporangium aurantiacum TaxID=35754 RepID=A0A9Q9IDI3_9ACTN|nr:TetM/TetW/TetO/TetS family tetracycline resistance ribosomal protection protein [Dactylosporangium aurantiacum]MDG6101826.1 TetM/TetW/TetO/TetS family tetracycline resistance ribosomal protection protein [Dactylosporangium aurantiacum]UWZ52370.1 TetM/TetW/TetO/TetS family tetracycline resistance ribosomal protection protein [Dactylosporangium aurantiacum]